MPPDPKMPGSDPVDPDANLPTYYDYRDNPTWDIKNKEELLAEDARLESLRKAAVKQAYETATQAGNVSGALMGAQDKGRQALLYQAAQAQASQAGQAGAGRSGANLAGLSQVAKDRGAAQAAYESATEGDIAKAKVEGAQAKLEAMKFEKEAGSRTEDRLKKRTYYMSEIRSILKRSSDFWGNNKKGAAKEIRMLAENEPDPAVRDWLLRYAADARKGNVAFS